MSDASQEGTLQQQDEVIRFTENGAMVRRWWGGVVHIGKADLMERHPSDPTPEEIAARASELRAMGDNELPSMWTGVSGPPIREVSIGRRGAIPVSPGAWRKTPPRGSYDP